jgi:UDP-N-acetylglucosamine 2-epimerase
MIKIHKNPLVIDFEKIITEPTNMKETEIEFVDFYLRKMDIDQIKHSEINIFTTPDSLGDFIGNIIRDYSDIFIEEKKDVHRDIQEVVFKFR